MQTRNKNFTIRTTVFDSIPYQHWTGTLTDTNGKSRSHAPRHKKNDNKRNAIFTTRLLGRSQSSCVKKLFYTATRRHDDSKLHVS